MIASSVSNISYLLEIMLYIIRFIFYSECIGGLPQLIRIE